MVVFAGASGTAGSGASMSARAARCSACLAALRFSGGPWRPVQYLRTVRARLPDSCHRQTKGGPYHHRRMHRMRTLYIAQKRLLFISIFIAVIPCCQAARPSSPPRTDGPDWRDFCLFRHSKPMPLAKRTAEAGSCDRPALSLKTISSPAASPVETA